MDHHRRDRERDRDSRRRHDDRVTDSPPPIARHEKNNPRTGLQNYWIDGAGINREVLQRQICFMLGNEARCKPDKFNNVPGFKIQAVRPFTDKQLEDLIEISEEYEKEKKETQRRDKRGYTDLPYENSKTYQRYDHQDRDSTPPYREEPFPSHAYPNRLPQETFPPQIQGYPGQYTVPPGHAQGNYPPGRRSPPPGQANYPMPNYPNTRRDFPDHGMNPHAGNMAYNYPSDSMDIDNRGYQPPAYGVPPSGAYNVPGVPHGGPQQHNAAYMNPASNFPGASNPGYNMNPSDMTPRYVPPMDPPMRAGNPRPGYDYDSSRIPNDYRGPVEKSDKRHGPDYRKR